jgi:ribosome modulation factor
MTKGDQPSGWTRFWQPRRKSQSPNPDTLVASWKTAWAHGAEARWTDKSSGGNPYTTGHERSAWEAGWRWAARNPDRRTRAVPLVAHHRRRATDAAPHLTRALQLGVAGLTVFGISRALHRWMRKT